MENSGLISVFVSDSANENPAGGIPFSYQFIKRFDLGMVFNIRIDLLYLRLRKTNRGGK